MPRPQSYLVYQELLLKKLTGGKRTAIEITAEQADAAVAEVEAEIRALGPDPDNLNAAYEAFMTRQRNPELFRGLRPDEDTIGPNNESRYAYSQRCRAEVLKAVRQRVLQTVEWHNALIRSGAVAPDGGAKAVSNRWMSLLMKTDGSPESRRYNDFLASLCSLGEGAITRAKYLELRQKDHEQFDNMSPEAAAAAAEKELEDAPESLYREISGRIEAQREQILRGKDAAIAIQTGDYTKFPGGMQEAYGIFYDPAALLAMTGKDVLDFLHDKLNLKRDNEELHEKMLEWQELTLPGNGMDSVAEQVSNPYFAILDPAKCDYYALAGQVPLVNANGSDDLAFSFIEGNLPRMTMELREMDEALHRFTLGSADQVKDARHGDFRVFAKDDRIVILKTGPMSGDHFLTFEDNMAGQYAFGGMYVRSLELQGTCNGWSTTKRTSREFEEMRARLAAVADLQLGDHPTLREAKAAALAVEELRAATVAYLERKRVHHWDTEYETQRIAFANDVLRFAKDRQLRIACYIGHLHTEELVRAAEEAAGLNPAWRNDPRYAGMSALEHQDAVAREQAEQRKRDAQRQKEEAERPWREAMAALRLVDGRNNQKAFDALLAQCGGELLSQEDAAARIEAFLTETTAQFRTAAETARNGKLYPGEKAAAAQAEQEAFTHAMTLVAGYAIAELLKAELAHLEQKLGPGEEPQPADIPIRRLVSAGKLADLAKILAASTRFQQAYAPQLFDPAKVEELVAKRNGPGVGGRGDILMAGREFLENIELARQNPEPVAEEPIEEKKQDVPPQNQIHEDEEEEINPKNKEKEPAAEEKKQEGPVDEPKQEAPKQNVIIEDYDDEEEEINPKNKQKAPAEEKREEPKQEEPVEEEPEEEPAEPDATREEKNLYHTIENMSLHAGEAEEDRSGIALEKLDKVLAEKRENLHPHDSADWLRHTGREALALSTLRCMLIISGEQKLANIITRAGYKALTEGIQETQDFQEEAKKVNLTDSESINKAIDNHFGRDTAYALLGKVNSLQYAELLRENYALRHAGMQPQQNPNDMQKK